MQRKNLKKEWVNKMNLAELKNESIGFDRAIKIPILLKNMGGQINEDIDHKAVVNEQKNDEVFSFVSNGYKVVQHQEVTESIIEALTLLNIRADAKVVLNSNRLIIDFDFVDNKIELKEVGEEFKSGIRLINSYDKTAGVFICPRIMRLACSNGMILTRFIKGFYAIHTSDICKDLSLKVKSLLVELADKQDDFKILVEEAIKDSIEWQYCEKLLIKLMGREKHRKEILSRIKALNKEVVTRWEIYNVVTAYATHDNFISVSVGEWLHTRAEKILMTPLIELR